MNAELRRRIRRAKGEGIKNYVVVNFLYDDRTRALRLAARRKLARAVKRAAARPSPDTQAAVAVQRLLVSALTAELDHRH